VIVETITSARAASIGSRPDRVSTASLPSATSIGYASLFLAVTVIGVIGALAVLPIRSVR
jgi:hypothetical protein